MSAEPANLSLSEWDIINVVWAFGPLSAKAVHEILVKKESDHDLDSVKTYLRRMAKKGAVDSVRHGRAYSYYTTCDKKPMVEAHLKKFWQSISIDYQVEALKMLINLSESLDKETRKQSVNFLDQGTH